MARGAAGNGNTTAASPRVTTVPAPAVPAAPVAGQSGVAPLIATSGGATVDANRPAPSSEPVAGVEMWAINSVGYPHLIRPRDERNPLSQPLYETRYFGPTSDRGRRFTVAENDVEGLERSGAAERFDPSKHDPNQIEGARPMVEGEARLVQNRGAMSGATSMPDPNEVGNRAAAGGPTGAAAALAHASGDFQSVQGEGTTERGTDAAANQGQDPAGPAGAAANTDPTAGGAAGRLPGTEGTDPGAERTGEDSAGGKTTSKPAEKS